MQIKLASCAIVLAVAGLASIEAIQATEQATPRVVACKQIRTPAQLQAMQNNLAGIYCLANDIDMSSIANFVPVGPEESPFTGRLFGNGHVIRNLTIDAPGIYYVGLFGLIEDGVVDDVHLVNVNINGGGNGGAGAVAGSISSSDTGNTGVLSRIQVSGKVKCTDTSCLVGGIVGYLQGSAQGLATLTEASSSAAVIGNDNAAGGAVGFYDGTISNTYATGPVTCLGVNGFSGCTAGGLVGRGNAKVRDSYALGAVTGGQAGAVGGLIGDTSAGVTLTRTFAAGAVTGGTGSFVGGLVGSLSGVVIASYSVGPVTGDSGATVGGLTGANFGTVTNSYWDTQTSGQTASGGGIGKTTPQLRAALQAGFGAAWAITRNLSYPFLNTNHIDYASPLATLVLSNKVLVFLPISQLDASQYLTPPAHADGAALATVYTMTARAIGISEGNAKLKGNGGKIDRYFWHDDTQTTTFNGPITTYATLGPLTNIAAATPLDASNVIGVFNQQKLVILRGTYTPSGGGTATHWMLGTLYTKIGAAVGTIVANDPWTGMQVEIDADDKTVISPAGFPLTNFTVDGYRSVTISN